MQGNMSVTGTGSFGGQVSYSNDGQYLKAYNSYDGTQGYVSSAYAPSTYCGVFSHGGLRVDFVHPSYGADGYWNHTLTWSGYRRYCAYQLAGGRYGSVSGTDNKPRLYARTTDGHSDSWGSWYELLTTYNMSSHVLQLSGGTMTGTITNNHNYFSSRCIFDLDYSTYNTQFKLNNSSTYGLIQFLENTTHKGFFGLGGSNQSFSSTTSSYSANGFTWNLDGAGHMIIANRGTSKMIRLCTGTEGNANFDTIRIENQTVNIRGTLDVTLGVDFGSGLDVAKGIIAQEDIQAKGDFVSASGNAGITKTGSSKVAIVDDRGDAHELEFENGLLIDYKVQSP
jgi:hypothetical protein